MSKTSCIVHAPGTRFVIVFADYLALCDGDDCAAALLHEFEHWHNFKLRRAEEGRSETAAAARAGEPAPAEPDEWVYWSRPEMAAQLFEMWGESKLDAAVKMLVDKGLIDSRRNPRYRFDRVLQYRFNVDLVQAALTSLETEGYDALNLRLRTLKSTASITAKSRQQYPSTHSRSTPSPSNSGGEGSASPGKTKRETTLEKVASNPYVKAFLGCWPDDETRPTIAAKWLEYAAALAQRGYTPAQVQGLTCRKLKAGSFGYRFGWLINDLPGYVAEQRGGLSVGPQQQEPGQSLITPERKAELERFAAETKERLAARKGQT